MKEHLAKEQFCHLRLYTSLELSSKGGATILFQYSSTEKRVFYRAAYCSPKDIYVRKIGRERAKQARWYSFYKASSNGIVESLRNKLRDGELEGAPKWTRKVEFY